MEPLGEARRDDPDHALVPVLVPEDVPTPSPLRLGERVHGRDGVAQDPILDRLALAIQLLEDVGQRRASSGSVVSTSSSATSGRPSRPAALIRGR